MAIFASDKTIKAGWVNARPYTRPDFYSKEWVFGCHYDDVCNHRQPYKDEDFVIPVAYRIRIKPKRSRDKTTGA